MRRALLAVVALVAVLATPGQASSADAPAAPPIAAASWYLVGEDGDVLARRDAARAHAIASITKLMTAVVVLEHARLDDVVRVSPLAADVGESTVYLRAGEELTVADLLRATLVPSANDAAEALALHVGGGSADRFVDLMNAKAAELGLRDTHFENPHGLDERGHVSSARDVTTLLRYALGVSFIRDAIQRSSVVLPGGRDVPDHRRPAPELGAARRREDRAYAGRRLVGDGRGESRRCDRLRGGARQRHAQRAERRAAGAPHVRPGPVPPGPGRRRRAHVRARRRPGTGSLRSSSSPRAHSCEPSALGTPLVERVVAPSALALPVAKGERLGPCRGLRREPARRVVEPRRSRRGRGCRAVGEGEVVCDARPRGICWELVT